MKYVITYCLLLVLSFQLRSQPDTISFLSDDRNNELIYGKGNWGVPKKPYYASAIEPYYDTIYLKSDSSLYNGYLIMYTVNAWPSRTDLCGTAIFKTVNGIPHLKKSEYYKFESSLTYNIRFWKTEKTIATDSNIIRYKYYPNGIIEEVHIQKYLPDSQDLAPLSLLIYKKYDSTGILTLNMRRIGRPYDSLLYDGLQFFLVNDSIPLSF